MRPTALDDAHRIFIGWLLGIAWRREWACRCPACALETVTLLSADVKLRAAAQKSSAAAQGEERAS